jgi:hypothetical protein
MSDADARQCAYDDKGVGTQVDTGHLGIKIYQGTRAREGRPAGTSKQIVEGC